MTKVNLLPDYIWEGRRLRNTALLVLVAIIAELAVLGFLYTQKQADLLAAETRRDEIKVQADEVDAINTKAEQIAATIKPITDKTNYIRQVLQHNNKFPSLFERTNMYTYHRVGYRQLQPQATVLNMTANARSVSDIGRYLLNIQRAKDTFTAVSITSQMPGWPSAPAEGGTASGYPGGSEYAAQNPFAPSSIAGPATQGYASVYGGGVPGASGYPGAGGFPGTAAVAAAPPAPTLLDFTAVGQLAQRFQLTPPAYAGGAAPADGAGTEYGAPGGGYPGASAYPGAPGGGYPPAGTNGGS